MQLKIRFPFPWSSRDPAEKFSFTKESQWNKKSERAKKKIFQHSTILFLKTISHRKEI